MTPAARTLRDAHAAGVSVHMELLDTIRLAAVSEPCTALLQRVREHKAGIVDILRGDACRSCGVSLPSAPSPLGSLVVFGDGTAECMACADREVGRLLAAGRRAVESPDALADEAEVMLPRGSLS